NGYVLYMPLEEDPSGSAPQMRDWVTDSLIGTSAGSMTSDDLVAGKVGKGLEFDGSNDCIDTPNVTPGLPVTASCWVYVPTTSVSGERFIFSEAGSTIQFNFNSNRWQVGVRGSGPSIISS